MSSDERIRMQVFVSPEVAKKIDELSDRLNMSRSNFLERLIGEGLKDNEWVIRAVTSPMAETIAEVLGVRKSKGRESTARGS